MDVCWQVLVRCNWERSGVWVCAGRCWSGVTGRGVVCGCAGRCWSGVTGRGVVCGCAGRCWSGVTGRGVVCGCELAGVGQV